MHVGISFDYKQDGKTLEVLVSNWTAEKLKEIWPVLIDVVARREQDPFPTEIVLRMGEKQ